VALSILLFVAAWRACRPPAPPRGPRRRRGPAAESPAHRGRRRCPDRRPRRRGRRTRATGRSRRAPAGAEEPREGAQRTAITARPAIRAPCRDAAEGDGREILVFSDYACPFCAKAHEDTEAALARNPGVRVVHRQFPLDPACNPLVKRAIHPGACALARAAICAEAQGKEREMSTALFRNQEARRPVESLAAELGLDLALFRTCIVAPGTEKRLTADVAEGIARGSR
jgi:hypothetical protein